MIIIPAQSVLYTNLPCHTINNVHCYPPEDELTLCYFGNLLGFSNVEDHDEAGRNVFHHLFACLKYCWLAGFIARNCFETHAMKMPGSYRRALRQLSFLQKTAHSQREIPKCTPLHILCNNSDACLLNLEIVKRMCFYDLVGVKNFETLSIKGPEDGQVIVPFMFTQPLTLDALFLKLNLR